MSSPHFFRPISKPILHLLSFFMLGLGFSSQAQVTWDGGGGDNLWSTAANWNPDGVPGDADDVVINGDYVVSVTSSDSCRSLQTIPANANNDNVQLIITNGARLGVQLDVDMDDRDRQNNSNILDIEDGATLYVGGDLLLTKDNGTSNNNDMLVRLSDDNSRLQVAGSMIADFTANNNNGNQMGFILSENSGITADSLYVEFQDNQESNTLISMNNGGAAGDSAFFQVGGVLIENTANSMDCIIDMDYEATLSVTNDFVYSAAAGEGFYLYLDRDAQLITGRDFIVTKDGNQEIYIYLNENADGSSADAQLTVGRDMRLTKTDGDDFFVRLSNHADITVTEDLFLSTTNEDDNGDDVIFLLSNDAQISIGDTASFTLNDNNNIDLIFDLVDDAILDINGAMTIDMTNVDAFEIEINDQSVVDITGDLFFQNTTSSSIPVIDMDDDGQLIIGGDLDWNDNTTVGDNNAGFFLDRDASMTITGDWIINKTTDGDLNIFLNQNNDGLTTDATITAANLFLDKDNGDDIDIRMGASSLIDIAGDVTINADNQDGNNDDILIDLTDDAAWDIGEDLFVTYSDNNGVDFFMQLNDNASFTTGDTFSVILVDATLFQIEMNGASTLDVGTDFYFENTTTSGLPQLDLDNTAAFTIGDDLIWNDNNTTDGGDQGFYLDRDASLDVTDSIIVTKTDDGFFRFYLNQNADGAGADAQVSASNFILTKSGGDDILFYMDADSDLNLDNDLVISSNDPDGNDDDVQVFLRDDASINAPGDFFISFTDDNRMDLNLQILNNGSVTVGDSMAIFQSDATLMTLTLSNAGSLSVGNDFYLQNTTTSQRPLVDMDNTASFTIAQDFIWIDSSNVNNSVSGLYLDRDASMTVADSFYVVKPADGHFYLFLNQNANGAAADAQFSSNSFEIDADDIDRVYVRLSDGSDMNVAQDFTINAQNSSADNHVEITVNGDAGLNVGRDLINVVNSVNAVDIDWNIATTDSVNVGRSIDLDLLDGDDIIVDISSSSYVGVGDDWSTDLTNGDNLLIDVYDDAEVVVADRLSSSVDITSDLLQFDMDNNGSIQCEDFIALQNSDETVIDNGILMDRDASLTVNDSLFWTQNNEGYCLFYLNQAADGSAADAQLACSTFVVVKDQGDLMAMRLSNDADVTVTGDYRMIATNHESGDDIELRLNNASGVDIGGDLVMSNTGGTLSDVRLFQFSSSDLDVGGSIDIDDQSQFVDIDLTGTGDINVVDDVSIDLLDGNQVSIVASNDGDWNIGDDWSVALDASSSIDVNITDNASIAVTDRTTMTSDGVATFIQFDLDSNGLYSTVDLIVNHGGDNAGNNGILLDRDATFTVTDSLFWTQTRNGSTLLYLNNNADGYLADAQLSAGTFVFDRDSGNILNIIVGDGADISVTNDWIIDSEEFVDGQHVVFNTSDNGGISVGGNLDIDLSRSAVANTDVRFNLVSTGDFDVTGDVMVDIPIGDDFDVNHSGDGDWNIGGDFLVTLGNADLLDFDLTNDADLSVGGDMTLQNTNTDARRVRMDLDNTASLTVGEDLLMLNSTTDNGDSETTLILDRDATVSVTDSISIVHNGNDDVFIYLNENAAGSSTDASLSAANLVVEKDGGDDFFVQTNETSSIDISNDMVLDFGTPEGTNDRLRLRLDNSSTVTVDGSLVVTYDNGAVGTGQDFTLDINNTSVLEVGPSAGPFTTESFTINLAQGDDVIGRIDDDASLIVNGDMVFNKTGADDIDFRLNDGAGTGAVMRVRNDLIIQNTPDDDFILMDINQNALLDVDGDIDLTDIDAQGLMEFNLDGSGEIELEGNFLFNASPNNFGILDMNNTSVLELNGSSARQFIPPNDGGGTDVFEYQNVVINNSTATVPQVVAAGDVLVQLSVDFQDGIVYASADSLLTFADDADALSENDTSHVNGLVEKVGNDTFTFPVGNGEQFRPCAISAPANTTDAITAQYFSENPYPLFGGGAAEGTLDRISSREYWNISQSNGTPSVDITLSWDTNSGGVVDLDSLRVAHFESGLWRDEGNGGTTGNATRGRVTSAAAIATFSPFTLATTNSINPLPVELLTFDAIPQIDGSVLVQWTTASEIDNDFFDVMRSRDGFNFHKIGKVTGAGNSNTERTYSFVDANPFPGISYYQLKQVDFDGASEFSDIDFVEFVVDPTQTNLLLFPNPTSSGKIALTGLNSDQRIRSVLYTDIAGRSIATHWELNGMLLEVRPAQHLPSGVYTLVVQSDLSLLSFGVVIQ